MSSENPLSGERHDLTPDTAPVEESTAAHSAGPLLDDDLSGRFIAGADWRFVEWNPALVDLLGHHPGDSLAGRSLIDYVADPLTLQTLLTRARNERRAGPVEYRVLRADGLVIEVSCVVSATCDEAGTITALRGQLLDVSEQRRLQMQIGGAARMELFGRFAGGLAHDFNNLLIAIDGQARRLVRELPAESALHRAASEIAAAAERATSLTHQLLAFSRRQVFELQPVDVHGLVNDACPALKQILGPGIALRVEASGAQPPIHADPAQLRSVLRNLASNASEAMPDGGTLTIRVGEVEVADPPQGKPWLRPGRYVRLTVADTGKGMDAAARASAFHPFFSTKGLGNGRGLGLAMVYGIVKQSRGFVWADSEAGSGASFTLLFPAHEGAPGRPVRHRAETILLIEPDARLRPMIDETLRARGYQVLAAASAAEALHAFAPGFGDVHLVLTAAGSDGGEQPLVPRLRTVNPSIQVLVMGSEDAARQTGILPTTPFIRKPFTLKALAEQVRAVLDSGEGRS